MLAMKRTRDVELRLSDSSTSGSSPAAKRPKHDIGSYFENRSRKLREQHGAPAVDGPTSTHASVLFKGVRAYVNTSAHSGLELRQIIQSNGGEVYLGPALGKLTHIVSRSLTEKKKEELLKRVGDGKASGRYIRAVTEDWVYACLAEGRRVDESHYSCMADAAQPDLFAMGAIREGPSTSVAVPIEVIGDDEREAGKQPIDSASTVVKPVLPRLLLKASSAKLKLSASGLVNARAARSSGSRSWCKHAPTKDPFRAEEELAGSTPQLPHRLP